MKEKMHLTDYERDILSGSMGETMAKILKTLVDFGEIFGATRLVEVKSMGHIVTSFGLDFLDPVYRIMEEINRGGLKAAEGFTADPRPDFDNIGCGFIEQLIFKKKIYSKQKHYEMQLEKAGLKNSRAFSCACYLDEVGNIPGKGEYLSWAESSAVVYANSVLGARCNRNSGMLELFGSIAGRVPYFGLLTDEGRRATWIVEVKCRNRPEAQVLGSAIGMKVMEDVPYITGLNEHLGSDLTPEVKSYLKDMGAAAASNGAVGLYHIDGLTPEARENGRKLLTKNAKIYLIDDAELNRIMESYPVMWQNRNSKPKLCFIGCPHLSLYQLEKWTDSIISALIETGRKKVMVRTVLTSAPDVIEKFRESENCRKLLSLGVKISSLCPLMYTSNPLSMMKPVMTNSNKLRTYSAARYYPDKKILNILSGKEVN